MTKLTIGQEVAVGGLLGGGIMAILVKVLFAGNPVLGFLLGAIISPFCYRPGEVLDWFKANTKQFRDNWIAWGFNDLFKEFKEVGGALRQSVLPIMCLVLGLGAGFGWLGAIINWRFPDALGSPGDQIIFSPAIFIYGGGVFLFREFLMLSHANIMELRKGRLSLSALFSKGMVERVSCEKKTGFLFHEHDSSHIHFELIDVALRPSPLWLGQIWQATKAHQMYASFKFFGVLALWPLVLLAWTLLLCFSPFVMLCDGLLALVRLALRGVVELGNLPRLSVMGGTLTGGLVALGLVGPVAGVVVTSMFTGAVVAYAMHQLAVLVPERAWNW